MPSFAQQLDAAEDLATSGALAGALVALTALQSGLDAGNSLPPHVIGG